MKSINEFLKELLASGDLQVIINDIDGTVFDSHQFIQHFAKRHESEYIEALTQCNSKTGQFRCVHSQIAQFLGDNQAQLGITRGYEDVISKDIFGNDVPNASWIK